MLVRLLAKSLWERKASSALVLLSVTSAAALLSAFLNLAFHLTEEMAKEFRAFGANILLVPKSEPLEIGIGGLRYVTAEEFAYLEEADLPALKTVFWRHNIVAFAPFLSRVVEVGGRRALLVGAWLDREISVAEPDGALPLSGKTRRAVGSAAGSFRTGLKSLSPWWRVEGRWPGEQPAVSLAGASLARELALAVGSALTLAYESRSLASPSSGSCEREASKTRGFLSISSRRKRSLVFRGK